MNNKLARLGTLLLCLPVLLLANHLSAQTSSYAASPEYKSMLEELKTNSPSPAFIATGVRPTPDANLKIQTHNNRRTLQLRTPTLELQVDKTNASLTVLNRTTQAAWTMPLGSSGVSAAATLTVTSIPKTNAWTLAVQQPGSVPTTTTIEWIQASVVRLTCVTTGQPTTIHVQGKLPLFGLGERFFQAGLTGTHMDVRPADHSGEPGHNWSYVAVPLVYSPGGLGLYADTVFDTNFEFAADGSSFTLRAAHNQVSLYLLSGVGPKAILNQYTAMTGRPDTPPLWTFGPWIVSLQGKDAVLEMAQKIRDQGIPASALWVYDELDEPNNLGWPFWFSSYYGNARAFNDELHSRGFKVLGYVHPYVREQMLPYLTPSEAYDKGVAEKLLVTGTDGLPHGPLFEPVRTGNIDFTNPRAVDWWQGMLTAAVRDQGWDGWMEDFGEYVDDGDHLAAGNGALLSEVYPLLYHKVTERIVHAINPDVVGFSRSGFVGTQRFSTMLWGGDQSHDWARDTGLPSVITAGITAGMSGYSTWGPDILSDGEDKELWLRWAEFGALTPVMRDHVWSKPQYSVNLWYDAETRALFKKYAILHASLVPYFAAYAEQAHRTGTPILRHTVLEYPDDPRTYTAEYQYLLGESLLIAPIIEPGATTRKLYLPHGEWVNYWTGEHYTGGNDVTVPAAIDVIPILVRAGSIVPFKPDPATLQWSDAHMLSGALVWKVYPSTTDKEASFSLPDGTEARAQRAQGVLKVEGSSPTQRPYEIMLWMQASPAKVALDGVALSAIAPISATGPGSGWWFDPGSHQFHAVFTATQFALSLLARSDADAR